MSNIISLVDNARKTEIPTIIWPITVDADFCNEDMLDEQILSDLNEVQGLIKAIVEANNQNISIPSLTARKVEDETHTLNVIAVKVNSYIDQDFSSLYWSILEEDADYDYVFSTDDSVNIINTTSAT